MKSLSRLYAFLENFDTENNVKIYDDSNNLIYEGKMGDVPQQISNMMRVIKGTVNNEGDYLVIKVTEQI